MKLNKKFMSLIAAFLLTIGLVACGGSEVPAESEEPGTEIEENDDTEDETEVDGTSAASESVRPEDLVGVMTDGANWMFAALGDITLEEDLLVQGEHHNRSGDVARKLALYAQERDGETVTITDEYTLTVPNMIVRSENLLVKHGTINGNVTVEANGFVLEEAQITGDLVFASQEYRDSAEIDESLVTGEVRVEE